MLAHLRELFLHQEWADVEFWRTIQSSTTDFIVWEWNGKPQAEWQK